MIRELRYDTWTKKQLSERLHWLSEIVMDNVPADDNGEPTQEKIEEILCSVFRVLANHPASLTLSIIEAIDAYS